MARKIISESIHSTCGLIKSKRGENPISVDLVMRGEFPTLVFSYEVYEDDDEVLKKIVLFELLKKGDFIESDEATLYKTFVVDDRVYYLYKLN